jgi:hypothetical protein
MANATLSGNSSYLNAIPGNAPLILRSAAAAGGQMGYGNFDPILDQGLDPTFPAMAAGLITDWMIQPGQSGQSYIMGLEGGHPEAHAWRKHGPDTPDALLKSAAEISKSPQTRFISEVEMAETVEGVIFSHYDEITSLASGGAPGSKKYLGPSVGYAGFQNRNGEIIPLAGRTEVYIIIKFDGRGKWFLLTAYPKH